MASNLVSITPRALGDLDRVGPIGFGCWRFTNTLESENARLISTAVDLGMNLIDTADVYGLDWGGSGFGACEEALGRVLAADSSLRNRIVLATKGGIIPGVPYDSSADYLVSACEASLRRLGVDHVDLFQIHRPDMFTHPNEVAAAFVSLFERGLVSAFGVSNYTPSQTWALLAHLDVPFVSVQPEFSCVATSPMRDGTLDLCMEEELVPLAWSPLAGGRIATGDGVRAELLDVLDRIAARESVTRATVALAFVLAHPSGPVALVGTQNPDRLLELSKVKGVVLSREDVYEILQASDGVKLP